MSQENGATLRVLVCDQDSELLEALSRAFDVDVATSKATCIDLLRANEFDVVIACERLSDGSGLELLSQVAQRWPSALRVLAIEPARRAMLKGHLAAFRLFEIIRYPFEAAQLEAVFDRAAELSASHPQQAASAAEPARESRRASVAPRASAAPTPDNFNRPRAKPPANAVKLPSKGGRVVPLGSPDADGYKILPRSFREDAVVAASRARRAGAALPSAPSKAAKFAAQAVAALSRYIKPEAAPVATPSRQRPTPKPPLPPAGADRKTRGPKR